MNEELKPLTVLSIDVKDRRGNHYKHDFVYTVPNIGKQIEIGRRKTALLPQAGSDGLSMFLTEAICYLEATLDPTRLPSWWKPMEMYDAAPITALYKEALDYERRFLGIADDSGAAQSIAESEPADDGGSESADPDDVERSLHTADERSKVVISHSSRSS